jgi:hypothetical protein
MPFAAYRIHGVNARCRHGDLLFAAEEYKRDDTNRGEQTNQQSDIRVHHRNNHYPNNDIDFTRRCHHNPVRANNSTATAGATGMPRYTSVADA